MIVEQQTVERLFDEAARRVRVSVRQSPGAIIQSSHQRLARDPGDLDAIHVIAASNLLDRNAQRTLDILARDPSILHDNAIGHRLAGYACLDDGRPDAARIHFDQSVKIDPCQPDCWLMLGQIHEACDEHEWAIEYYQRGVVFDQQDHRPAIALSKLYAKKNDLNQAIHILRVSLLRDRRAAKLNFALARLLERRASFLARRKRMVMSRKILTEAWDRYLTGNCSEPSSSTLVAQGVLEQRLERYDDARTSFQRAVDLDPMCPVAVTHLANANVDGGEIDQALQQYEKAIELDPEHAATHFRYSRAKRFAVESEAAAYIEKLSSLVADTERPARHQVHLNFALAKVLDDLGRYDEAWVCYDRANRLKPGHSQSVTSRRRAAGAKAPAPVPLRRVTENAIQFFTKDFLNTAHNVNSGEVTPVFIVGMPRSGTTLTEQILSSHPQIAGAGELKLMEQTRQRLAAEARSSNDPTIAQNAYPEILSSLHPHRLEELASAYLGHLNKIRTTETHVTDKMPTNFMHLGLIATLFPNARIIHCRRNPMDVIVSCYCQNLNAPFCDLDQLALYHREYRRLMAHWLEVLPLAIHEVDYEALVTEPEQNSRALVQHCGLEWDDRCLKFHANSRAVHTPSKWQVRQPMYSSSVEKWRRFEKHLNSVQEQVFA